MRLAGFIFQIKQFRKENTHTMKKTLKLIPALAMLLVSAILVSTSTYAWFSMNNRVTVTGMQVKATVSDSLLIASSSEGTSKSADSAFTKGINQPVSGILQPVSTISGAKDSFYYTYDAKADGSKATAVAQEPYIAVPKTGTDAYKVDDGTGTAKDAFKDYVFEIKAINANSSASKNLILTKLNLLYDGAAVTEHAYRVAIFTQEEATGGTAYGELATTTAADAIYAPSGFEYFNNTAVSSTAQKAAVSPTVNNSTTWAKTVAKQTTSYFKITVRLWLEGEDTDCYTSQFVTLTDSWTLDLAFELSTTDSSVALIGSAANLALTGTGNTRTAPSGTIASGQALEGEQIVSHQWYKDNLNALPDTAVDSATSASFTATEAGSYYCVVTTAKGTQYRTDSFDYVAPTTP